MSGKQRNSLRQMFHRNWEQRISLVYLVLMPLLTAASFTGGLLSLPATPPDHYWVTDTARSMLTTDLPPALVGLAVVAMYVLVPEVRRYVARYPSTRLARLAAAVVVPSCVAFLAYSVALLLQPRLWNRLLFVLPFGPIVASFIILFVAVVLGYRDRSHLSQN